jgi:membrane protein implicated in regulation of membrane protease activity
MLNLILFHRLLIATGIVFCAVFAAWEFGAYTRAGGAKSLILAIVFALLAVALSWYLKRLARVLNLPDNRNRRA